MTINTADEFLNVVVKDIQNLVKRRAEKLFNLIVSYTPVLSGNLRASWSMAEGFPELLDVNVGTISSPAPPPATPTLTLTQDFPVVHISNGKSYALFVEHGTTKMTPRAMVARALADLDI